MVLGKGGVGRSTLAAALCMMLAREGRRVLAAEVTSEERLPALLRGAAEAPVGYEPTPVSPGVDAISIDPQKALQEYLSLQLPLGLGRRLLEHGAFSTLAAAAPGLREMVTMGKLWFMLEQRAAHGDRPRWDAVVVDAPATGHGLALLGTPRTFTGLARTGRVHDQAGMIASLLTDPERAAVVLVARPEELPVTEAGEAADALRERLGIRLALVVANGVEDVPFAERRDALEQLAARDGTLPPLAAAAVATAVTGLERRDAQQVEVRRLALRTGLEPVRLPLLDADHVGPREIGVLAEQLEAACP